MLKSPRDLASPKGGSSAKSQNFAGEESSALADNKRSKATENKNTEKYSMASRNKGGNTEGEKVSKTNEESASNTKSKKVLEAIKKIVEEKEAVQNRSKVEDSNK